MASPGTLGGGPGLSSVSPWAQADVGATTLGVSTIAWLTLTQLLASGMGGYLAGRLRTKWTEVHPDEVYFRDTAHGFLAWAVASLATAALLSSVVGSIVGGGIQAASTVAAGLRQRLKKRVTDTYERARAQAQVLEAETATREAADTARQASAYAALWIFISLLVGAFVASLAATFGGRQRDA